MPEKTDLEKQIWVQRFKVLGVVLAVIAGVLGLGTTLKAAGMPMPIFTPEIAVIRQAYDAQIRELYILQAQAEVDARNRIDRSNQMTLFDLQMKIDDAKKQQGVIPPPVIDQYMRMQEDTKQNIQLREQAIKRIELNQKLKM
jgi:hypothetical protein